MAHAEHARGLSRPASHDLVEAFFTKTGTKRPGQTLNTRHKREESVMKGAALWFLGIPIPIIILLYLFGVF
jgi:hypothetical protein